MSLERTSANRVTSLLALLAVLAAALAGPARAADAPAPPPAPEPPPPTYQNPVFGLDFPDPMVLKVGRDYYAYATSTSWQARGRRFPILRSRDLVHWTGAGDAFTSPPEWASGNWWAPHVVERRGRFFLYYTARSRRARTLCVAVASASGPTGPFTHRAVLACGDSTHSGYIDPAVLLDDDGRAYLYFARKGARHSISVLPLRRSLVAPAGPPHQLYGVSQPWEVGLNYATVEAPFPLKRGGRYQLFYSANDWRQDYQMGVAAAPRPLGPFRKSAANPVLNGRPNVSGPGGGSIVEGPRGGLWLVYAAWVRSGLPGDTGVRNLRVDPLRRAPDGSLSIDGPSGEPRPAP